MTEFQPYVPDDFDEFWAEILAEANSVPLYFRRERAPEHDTSTHLVDRISFRGGQELMLEGWIAYPEGARRSPAFVWVPPYGRESLLPNEYGTREGLVSLSLNLHGLGAFHQEKYVVHRGYFGQGALEPGTWIFRTLIQHVLVALRILQAQSEADEDRIAVSGMSQGAGLSLWAGAFSPIVRCVCADMPFLGAMRFALSRNAYRYPLKELVDVMDDAPLGRERVMHTLSYYDTMNVATRVKVPALVSYGLKDPACRLEAVKAIFDAIPGEAKRLVEYPGGHDWDREMVGHNRAYMLENMG